MLKMFFKKKLRLILMGSWLFTLGAGYSVITKYMHTPGLQNPAPFHWPTTALMNDSKKPRLLVFLNPYCACASATLNELERMMPDLVNKVEVRILFFIPSEKDPSWAHTDLWRKANRISGVSTAIDVGRTVAGRFGALTSGQVVLYSADGVLIFQGGLTTARGHEGLSPGRMAIVSYVRTNRSLSSASPVFGCPFMHEELINERKQLGDKDEESAFGR